MAFKNENLGKVLGETAKPIYYSPNLYVYLPYP